MLATKPTAPSIVPGIWQVPKTYLLNKLVSDKALAAVSSYNQKINKNKKTNTKQNRKQWNNSPTKILTVYKHRYLHKRYKSV